MCRTHRSEYSTEDDLWWCCLKKGFKSPGCKLQKHEVFENDEEEDSNWDEMFQRLGRYKETHGKCHVPLDYVDDRVLSAWVFHQRTLCKIHSMASEKQTRLESLGFAWNIDGNNTPFCQCKYDLQWDEMF